MLRLRDIMTRDVITMGPELGIRDAMAILANRHIGGAPVVAFGKVLGIVSTTDLLMLASSLPPVPRERADPVDEEDRDELPVWDQEAEPPTTYFTELWADAGADVSERFAQAGGPEWDSLGEHTVADAMSRGPVCALPPDAPVAAAADYMRRADVHRILVMQGNRLLGVVSTMDVTRAVADRKIATKVFVFGERAAPDARGCGFVGESVSSGEVEEDREAPGSPELPSGELEEEQGTGTSAEEIP